MNDNPHADGQTAWYELVPTPEGFAVDVAPKAQAYVAGLSPDIPLFLDPPRRIGVPAFAASDRVWGYGGALVRQRLATGWARYLVLAPFERRWIEHAKISASLGALFQALTWMCSSMGEGEKKQLLVVDGLATDPGFAGADLEVFITPTLRRWLDERQAKRLIAVEEAMHMWLRRSYPNVVRHWQQADICSHGRLSLQIHADATSLSSDPHDLDVSFGSRLGGHNVDHPMHQLGLLAGLAELNVLARQAGL